MKEYKNYRIHDRYTNTAFNILNELAEDMGAVGFVNFHVECNKSISKNAPSKQEFWVAWDDECDCYKIYSNTVKNRPRELYDRDLYRPDYIEAIVKSFIEASSNFIKRKEAEKHVEDGGKCYFQYGLGYRGARRAEISNDVAKEKIKKHSFGIGFYTMFWCDEGDGTRSLVFNELGENDLY